MRRERTVPAGEGRSLTEMEWSIMDTIWTEQPCAVGTVQEALAAKHGWAYSTIKTAMDRMVTKKYLSTERIRNLTLYRAIIDRASAQRMEFRQCVRRAFRGAIAPMLQFLVEDEAISKEELDELRQLLQRRDSKSNAKK